MGDKSKVKGKARVAFHLKGTVGVVLPKGVAEEEKLLNQASVQGQLLKWAARWVLVVEGEETYEVQAAAGAQRQVQVQALLVSVLSALGGTRYSGKAPRAPLARKVRAALAQGGVAGAADEDGD